MGKKTIIMIGLVVVLALGAGTWYILTKDGDGSGAKKSTDTTKTTEPKDQPKKDTDESTKKDQPKDSEKVAKADGRYVDYEASKVSAKGYERTLLFFHAPWCPECQAFDKAIKNGQIPAGVQILKVDYDSNKDLRQKYGVTVQTTFVRVDANGNKQSAWKGYGSASLDALLENTK